MPTYEYACKSCGEHVEVVQSFKDEPLTECPACGGPLRKVFGSIGISFKGSGFYKTDSRATTGGSRGKSGDGKPETAAGGGDPGGAAKSGTSGSSGSDSSSGSGSSSDSGSGAASTSGAKSAAS
jgi:putative FmdB family regulatory protein